MKDLKVGYLVSEFPKLSETFVRDEIKEHLEHHLDVIVISLRQARQDALSNEEGRIAGISVENVFAKHRWAHLLEQIRLVTLSLATIPAVWRVVVGRGYGKLSERVSILALAYRLRQIEARRRLDVLHCHFGRQGRYAAILRQIGLLQAKIVTTFHGFDISSTVVSRGRDHYDVLFKHGDLFLPISEYWARGLRELGCDPKRIIVHHMGVDCTTNGYNARRPGSNDTIRLISIGRFVEKKGHQYTLRALAVLRARRPDLPISFDLIGDGPLKSQMIAEAGALGLDEVVTFHGALEHSDTLALLNRASIFVLPSVTSADGDMEGIPVSLMEAMARGMPVISTYHSGIPELVEDGQSGLLVPERDTNALALAMEQMIDGAPDWTRYGMAARHKVEAEFNRRALGQRLVEIYRFLLPQPAG